MVDVHFPSAHFVVVQPTFEQIVVVTLPAPTFFDALVVVLADGACLAEVVLARGGVFEVVVS